MYILYSYRHQPHISTTRRIIIIFSYILCVQYSADSFNCLPLLQIDSCCNIVVGNSNVKVKPAHHQLERELKTEVGHRQLINAQLLMQKLRATSSKCLAQMFVQTSVLEAAARARYIQQSATAINWQVQTSSQN